MSFPSLQLDSAASPLSPLPLFFVLAFCFLIWLQSQDIIETGVGIKQHDLARFLPVPPHHPCWLREIIEDGGGSEGGHQCRESPDSSAALLPVFEGLLFCASLIYLIFSQGSPSALGTWESDSKAHRQLFLRTRRVNLLWELSDAVCQLVRAVPA